MQQPEILAPAGSMESLQAAVYCGADAVYLGGTSYSARSSAANFDLEQLRGASRLCRLYGVGLHLAVNTLLTDTELPAFRDYLKAAGQYADAMIVQDLGAVRLIRELLPEMPIHASTQMSIHTPEGAVQAAALGCCRVVAAREMSADDLAALCKLPVEVEAFVHGALCMSVSGQCSFSAVVGGRSANRGACAQACRLPWKTPGGRNPAALSLRDLDLTEHVQSLCDMGIRSFKIEGRMKRPEYVAAAVTALKTALSGGKPDLETLQAVFSRSGFTDGYFTGRKNREMFGYRRREDVLAGQQVHEVLAQSYAKPRILGALDFSMQLTSGKPAQLTAQDGKGNAVCVSGDIPALPQRSPLTRELLAKSMQKLGRTAFTCGAVSLENPEELFLSAAQCNAMRRGAVEAIESLYIRQNTPACPVQDIPLTLPALRKPEQTRTFRLHVRTREQLAKGLQTDCIVCIPPALAAQCTPSESVYVETRRVIADESSYREQLAALREKGFSHLICHNLADIRIGKALGYILHGGFGLNVTNRLTALTLRELGLQDVTASIELRTPRIAALGNVLPAGMFAYGRLPMMLLRVCPVRAQDGCRHRDCFLTDRTGRQFPLLCSGDYQELVNAETLWLAGKKLPAELCDCYFTDEPPGEIPRVLDAYRTGEGIPPKARTGGLYDKGGLL